MAGDESVIVKPKVSLKRGRIKTGCRGFTVCYNAPYTNTHHSIDIDSTRTFAWIIKRKIENALVDQLITSATGLMVGGTIQEHGHGLLPARTTLDDFWGKFSEAKKLRLKPRSLAGYAYHLQQFRKMFPDIMTIQEITQDHAERYINDRAQHVGPVTVNSILNSLKVLFAFACKRHLLYDNPFNAVDKFKEPPLQITTISYAEELRLYKAVKAQAKPPLERLKSMAIIKLAIEGGMRNSEIRYLRRKDINLDSGSIGITCRPGWSTKNGRDRVAFIYKDTIVLFKKLFKQSKATGDDMPFYYYDAPSLSKKFKRIAVRAGVDCTLHDLRRTAASRIVCAGHSLLVASEYIGDISANITRKHYINISSDVIHGAGRSGLKYALKHPEIGHSR